MSLEETIQIEGLDEEIPEDARERINDAIHDILREEYGVSPDVVYWLEPLDMTECAGCGFTDVRRSGARCPHCGGVMIR